MSEASQFNGFKIVPKTGVIYVMTEASKRGFHEERELWANLGQGAPETGLIEGAPERIHNIKVEDSTLEYAPVGGTKELKEAVAELYNHRYRKGKKSKYTSENVAIGSGGRLALTRVVSTLGSSHIGHFLPDYTAYEELLGSFGTFVPIPILLSADNNYYFSHEDLKKEITGKGLSTVLISNPLNPCGTIIKEDNLSKWIDTAKDLECVLLFDEFYSHYIYDSDSSYLSAAEYVNDVNSDPVILFDGLTKNWRYPGLRISWTLGPKTLIEAITSAGSFLDGGAPHPVQKAITPLLSPGHALLEAKAIQKLFTKKRAYLTEELRKLNILVHSPEGGFYCWGDLSSLHPKLQSGHDFFEALIKNKCIIVPGSFFDINPGKRRPSKSTRFRKFARFSFGPPQEELELGVSYLKKTITENS
jgi:aspartate/methionine/tyrosine aminotransferase